MAGPLQGQVAIVTGASRGIGKGVALGLGEAGATVYVTGRTVATDAAGLPGTVGETAAAVTALGGHGIAVVCDHAQDAEVEALFARVQQEQNRFDLLVNNAIGAGASTTGMPFWELPVSLWDQLHTVGLRSHYVASRLAARQMVVQRRGLIVNISSAGAAQYTFNVPYGVGKAALDRLTADTAHELKAHGVAVVSLWPGFTRTEGVVALGDRIPAAVLQRAASPHFTGRAVAALATDPAILTKTGQVLSIFDLMDEYQFTDLDGTQPPATHPRRSATTPSA